VSICSEFRVRSPINAPVIGKQLFDQGYT